MFEREEEDVEKTFQHYLDLPSEVRIMMINEMETKERCGFRKCSKLCNKEVNSSKNYIYSLKLFAHNEDEITIHINYNKEENDPYKEYNERIQFKKVGIEQFAMRCTTTLLVDCNLYRMNKEIWRKKLNKSTDLVEYAAGYFKKLLKDHQKNIKYLVIRGVLFESKLKDYDFGIERFNNLEELSIEGSMDVPLYLSKSRRPLRKIYIDTQGDDNIAENEQIYQIRECMSAPRTRFTIEQLLRLSASVVDVDIGDLTEKDIFDFIRSWQNGTIGTERRVYRWMSLRFSNFDILKLFRLLVGQVYFLAQGTTIEIQHNKEAGNIAILSFVKGFYVKFEVRGRSKEIKM